jgi:hypothetical protein
MCFLYNELADPGHPLARLGGPPSMQVPYFRETKKSKEMAAKDFLSLFPLSITLMLPEALKPLIFNGRTPD